MTNKVSCVCGNTFEESDSDPNPTGRCSACQRTLNGKQTRAEPPVTSGTQFCRHCNAETPHEFGAVIGATYMPERLSGFWGGVTDFKRLAAERCLTCGHLELFAKPPSHSPG